MLPEIAPPNSNRIPDGTESLTTPDKLLDIIDEKRIPVDPADAPTDMAGRERPWVGHGQNTTR